MMYTLKRYGGVILFAAFLGIKIGTMAADHDEFTLRFAVWTICAFAEGWLLHSLQINHVFSELRKENMKMRAIYVDYCRLAQKEMKGKHEDSSEGNDSQKDESL